MSTQLSNFFFFFFNDTATTEIYTLSLHDALPISDRGPAFDLGSGGELQGACGGDARHLGRPRPLPARQGRADGRVLPDRKSTRLNSSHVRISYAVFCLKKKKNHEPARGTAFRAKP